ncbi:MAG: carbon-nitrogen hydrolase family protein [Alphaproteobacteria bacterium]|nr:carbon-nitrogen hydrolase family protein [Alphaproteobacteria bacterium]
MRAAAVQFKATKGDLAGSLERLAALTDEAAADADLVVLPEMAATGYVFERRDEVEAVAEAARGPTLAALGAVARAREAWIVCGFPERDGDHLYNSALVVAPDGELATVYRKTLLFEADEHWARPGDGAYTCLATPVGRVAVGICMDLNDPRFLLWLWRARPDVLAFPTNWVDEGADVWPYWAARVRASGAVLVAANTYGRDGAWAFSGASVILAGRRVLAAGPREGDAVVRADW